ncbi:MAG: hypothetical protein O9340_14345 [Cyclobacteriaceae bacterium]|nr:hypothetical protein [Cyclobacteriaceae bacterium]
MNKTEFLELIRNFPESTKDEVHAVLNLSKLYPYSQMLHALAARLSKENQVENHQHILQLAAVYASDRHILKELMVLQPTFRGLQHDFAEEGKNDGVDYADLVMHDLELLHQSKHNFEVLLADFESHAQSNKKKLPVKSDSKATIKSKSKLKSKVVTKVKPTKTSHKTKAKKAVKTKRKGLSGDDLISEIESTHRKLKPKSSKQQQQIALIDKFMKKQPSISPPKPKANPSGNPVLSGIKQGEFDQHIISETLVKILIGQGKNDKAIELLKKLIWKFPQKKAYFAAQIEDLKK